MKELKTKNSKLKTAGFTVIEILIILVIVVVVSTVTVVYAFKYKSSQDLKLTLNELSSLIRDTQKKSVTQQDGKRWGVRFENAESGRDKVYVFSGMSFASGTLTQSILLRRSAQFGEPTVSSTRDVIFLPIEGSISPNKVITLTTGLRDGLIGDLIINFLGRVTARTDTGLVGYWHFDEEDGENVFDSSGLGNNGVASEGFYHSQSSLCRSGSCFSFSGDGSQTITVPVSDDLKPTKFSISYWFYSNSNDTSPFHVSNFESPTCSNGYAIGMREGVLYFCIGTGGANEIGGGSLETGRWYHVVGVYDPPNQKLYLDGELNAETESPDINYEGITGNLFLGSSDVDPEKYSFNGYLDEVRIYNRALSATEITNIYNDLK